MSKHVLAIAALSALMACAAAAQPETNSARALTAEAAAADCGVRFTPTRHGLRIEALAHSERPGDYELVVNKNGPSGTSEVVQGGPIAAAPGAELVLSAAEFGVERGDRYRARLVLRDADGVFCRAERRS